jgi:hypothetical protein
MSNPSPTMSLWLDGWQYIQLGRKGFAGPTPVIKVHMHDRSRAATLVIPCYQSSTRSLSLQRALQCGIFDLFDAESHTKISVPQEDIEVEELVVKAGAPIRLFDLELEPRDEFWTQLLIPGHKYEIRWAHSDKTPWAYRGEVHQDTHERLSVHLDDKSITYTVLDNSTTPILVSVSVKPTDEVCHLSGESPFGFKLEVTSLCNDIITICLDKTPLKELNGLEDIVKVEDEEGQRVDWDWGIGCWEDTNTFPSDFMFEEFKPNVPYEKMFWLSKLRKNGNGGELGDLEADKKYTGKVSKTLLRSFGLKTQRGSKKELLAGSEQEKKERWAKGSEPIFLDVSDLFTFKTV